jgi:hypothetical protein
LLAFEVRANPVQSILRPEFSAAGRRLPSVKSRTAAVETRVGPPLLSAPPVLERPGDRRVVRDPQEDLGRVLEPFRLRRFYRNGVRPVNP